jgi:sn-glycerol 3-phosphate transport system substrate-binding protein
MKKLTLCAIAAGAAALTPVAASAQTEIQFWHAFTGRLGELLAAQVDTFNASQGDYVVVAEPQGQLFRDAERRHRRLPRRRAAPHPPGLRGRHGDDDGRRGRHRPVYQVMAEAGADFDPTPLSAGQRLLHHLRRPHAVDALQLLDPGALRQPRRSSPRGLDPDMDLSTWQAVGGALDALHEAGVSCPLTTAWQSWIHLENLSAWHNQPFATMENGFGGLGTELAFNGPVQVAHIQQMGDWAQDGKFIYAGRRNEGGANFRAGECALFTESSAGYAGVKAEAEFDFEIRQLPYWEGVEGAPQNTIIGGASLWVLEGHEPEEYAGVAAF